MGEHSYLQKKTLSADGGEGEKKGRVCIGYKQGSTGDFFFFFVFFLLLGCCFFFSFLRSHPDKKIHFFIDFLDHSSVPKKT